MDATFGRGGHSREILLQLGESGRLIAFDRDPAAIEASQAILDKRFCIIHGSFSSIRKRLQDMGIARIDGVLLDLGVSSPQLEEISRGFSFRLAGPLDMRMDTTQGETAAAWLATVSEDQLEKVIREYGEERHARQIARAIIVARTRRPVVLPHYNLPRLSQRSCVRASGKVFGIRRRALFRRFGFISIRNLRSCR